MLCLGGVALLSSCAGDEKQAPELILLISVDTLRADALGAYGAVGAETSAIDALAEESLVFERNYAPASFTVPSITTLLTGYYPEQNVVYSNEHVLPEAVPTMASHLGQRGYSSGAVVSNFVLRAETGLDRAFDFYDDSMPEREVARGLPERIAQETTADALDMLDLLMDEDGGRIFLWVHYQDPHGPYTPAEGERSRFLDAELAQPDGRRELELGPDQRGLGALPDYQEVEGQRQVAFYRAGYRAEIAATDRAIGELLDGIKARMPWDQTLTIFTADHGEGLGEGDYWFAHGEVLTEPLTRVPLMIRAPGLGVGRRSDIAGLIDVVPTLLPLIGLAVDGDLPGRNLLAAGASSQTSELYISSLLGSSVGRVGLIADEHLYQVTENGGGQAIEELYRLGSPGEDIGKESPSLIQSMRARLGALRPRLRAKGEERLQSLSDSDRATMRALGYTDSGASHSEDH
ncbi:MAG: arylsulfatase A-like enzyme [Planctomycetota bacterium]